MTEAIDGSEIGTALATLFDDLGLESGTDHDETALVVREDSSSSTSTAAAASSASRSPTSDPDPLRDRIDDLVARSEEAPIRAALDKLSSDHVTLLVDLLEGFRSRREILEWQQDVAIHSLGQIDDEWHTRTACDAPSVAALLGEPWGTSSGFDAETALEIRRGFAAKFVLPAFHEALREFRWSAVERVEHLDDDGEEDKEPVENPESQQFPAMRPELGELDHRQEWALESLLDGFGDADELLLWGQQVASASYAEIDADTVMRAYFERPIRTYLTGARTDSRSRFMRESWAAKYLLPSFNRAAASLATRATEVSSSIEDRAEGGSGSIS